MFMVDDMPDTDRFISVVGDIVNRSRLTMSNGRVFGEMVSLLWEDNLPAATRLEELWNDAVDAHSQSLLCTYTLCGASHEELPESLAALHTHNLS
jgi:hypothetical protein